MSLIIDFAKTSVVGTLIRYSFFLRNKFKKLICLCNDLSIRLFYINLTDCTLFIITKIYSYESWILRTYVHQPVNVDPNGQPIRGNDHFILEASEAFSVQALHILQENVVSKDLLQLCGVARKGSELICRHSGKGGISRGENGDVVS